METTELKLIDQLLGEIKKRKTTYASGIWVPSLKKDVRFHEMDTSQQKRLIKSILDSSIYDTEFILTLRDILKENCVEPNIDIDNFTVIDQLFVAVNLRSNSIGSKIPMEVEVQGEDQKPAKMSVDIDLDQVLTLAKKNLQIIEPQKFEDTIFEVVCSAPTIKTVVELEKQLHVSQGTKPTIETNEQLSEALGDAFIEETVKFVKGVVIKNNGPAINWDILSYEDRVKIAGTFSLALLKQLVTYMNTIRTESDKIELVNFVFNGKTYQKRLTIDANFFTIS